MNALPMKRKAKGVESLWRKVIRHDGPPWPAKDFRPLVIRQQASRKRKEGPK